MSKLSKLSSSKKFTKSDSNGLTFTSRIQTPAGQFPRIGQPGFSFGGADEHAQRAGIEPPMFMAHPTERGLANVKMILLAAGISANQIVRFHLHGLKPEAERPDLTGISQADLALADTTRGWNNFLYVQEPTRKQARLFKMLVAAKLHKETSVLDAVVKQEQVANA